MFVGVEIIENENRSNIEKVTVDWSRSFFGKEGVVWGFRSDSNWGVVMATA